MIGCQWLSHGASVKMYWYTVALALAYPAAGHVTSISGSEPAASESRSRNTAGVTHWQSESEAQAASGILLVLLRVRD